MNFPVQLQTFAAGNCFIELFVPHAGAVKEVYQRGAIAFPYWSRIWPSAIALAQFLVRHPHYTEAKTVVELGAGVGLPSLIAARNAKAVLCTDYVAEAVEIAALSAAHAGLQNFTASVLDWQHLPQNLEADVLLLSDINYEPAAFALLLEIINTFIAKGTTVLLSTPQRLMAKDFIAPLLADCALQEEATVLHDGKNVPVTVLVLERKQAGF